MFGSSPQDQLQLEVLGLVALLIRTVELIDF